MRVYLSLLSIRIQYENSVVVTTPKLGIIQRCWWQWGNEYLPFCSQTIRPSDSTKLENDFIIRREIDDKYICLIYKEEQLKQKLQLTCYVFYKWGYSDTLCNVLSTCISAIGYDRVPLYTVCQSIA
jgi:hypothetical protein